MAVLAFIFPQARKLLTPSAASFVVLLFCFLINGCGASSTASTTPQVPTASLQAASSTIAPGQSVVLTWTSSNATAINITPVISSSALPLSGTMMVTPQSTTNYTLTASGPGGSASASATVDVSAPTPSPSPAVTLTSSAATITAGHPVTLTWTSSNASSVAIVPAVGASPLPLNGSAAVSPTATTTYTITATGTQATANASAPVTVNAPGVALSPVNHVIVVWMQNHSFDNLFGTYPAANGLDPTLPSYSQVDAAGHTITPTLLTTLTTPGINHDSVSYAETVDSGKMDKFAFYNGDISMQYFDNTVTGTTSNGKPYGINTLWNYAQQYTLADNFFASALNSEPANVLYMVAATVHSLGTAGRYPYYDNCSAVAVTQQGGSISVPLAETNVGDQLTANQVPWVWYHAQFNTSQDGTCVNYVPQENAFQYFTTTQNSAHLQNFTLASFQQTLSSGSLPAVSWITPAPFDSMHPGSGNMADGIQWLDSVVQDVKNSPEWPSTLLLVLWDESGGWYDHVPPPQLANTVGLGPRVPVIAISPFAKPGAISHQQMDFVSILRFIQWNWGLGTFADAGQNAREQQSGDLCDLLAIPCGAP